jgi:hypothetical protein
MFVHKELFSFPKLTLVDTETERYYITPKGDRYLSVTTILGMLEDKEYLEEWKKRVGEEEAVKIMKTAANRGKSIHTIAEKYLKNDPYYLKGSMPINKYMFNHIKPFIDNNVKEVYAIETMMYSDELKTAGTCDLFCDYSSKLSILDFKNSIRAKKKEWIEGYFKQVATYAIMVEELSGIVVEQGVILITTTDGDPQEFIVDLKEYKNIVKEEFKGISEKLSCLKG